IRRLIADHVRARELEPVLALRLEKEPRLRLPACAALVRAVWTDQKAVDPCTVRQRDPCQAGVDVIDRLSRDHPATDRGLVRRHEDARAGCSEPSKGRECPGNELYLRPGLHVVRPVTNENAVTVDEDRD